MFDVSEENWAVGVRQAVQGRAFGGGGVSDEEYSEFGHSTELVGCSASVDVRREKKSESSTSMGVCEKMIGERVEVEGVRLEDEKMRRRSKSGVWDYSWKKS